MNVSQPCTEDRAHIRRILVATDLSPAARLAVARAGLLARQNDARLHVVHAQPDWEQFSRSGAAKAHHYQTLIEHADSGLSEELQFIEKTYGIHATCETRTGRASSVLRTAIAEFSPHLIVVGALGEHEPQGGGPLLGGTALKLIAFAATPVLLVRRKASVPYESSLAAIESPGASALEIIRWACALAVSGRCHVVHAFDAPYVERLRRFGLSEEAASAISEDARQAAVAFVESTLKSSNATRLSTHLICGEPVSAVLEELERIRPDVAIVGKHGHPPRDTLLPSIGSVAVRIAYHASCDVLVVPA